MENRIKYLEVEDVERLVQAASTLKNELIIQTLFTLGLRVSELTGILLTHINRPKKQVIVYGKKGESRILPVPEYLYYSWVSHIHKRKPKDYLFENAFGACYDQRRIRQIVYDAADVCGLSDVYPHKLRHSRATQLLNDDMPIGKLQLFLGHKDSRSTAVYTHVAPEPLRKYL